MVSDAGSSPVARASASRTSGVNLTGPAAQLLDEVNATGAVLVGRWTAEFIDHWAVIITVSRLSCVRVGIDGTSASDDYNTSVAGTAIGNTAVYGPE